MNIKYSVIIDQVFVNALAEIVTYKPEKNEEGKIDKKLRIPTESSFRAFKVYNAITQHIKDFNKQATDIKDTFGSLDEEKSKYSYGNSDNRKAVEAALDELGNQMVDIPFNNIKLPSFVGDELSDIEKWTLVDSGIFCIDGLDTDALSEDGDSDE